MIFFVSVRWLLPWHVIMVSEPLFYGTVIELPIVCMVCWLKTTYRYYVFDVKNIVWLSRFLLLINSNFLM
ncbi:hypothetical protein BDA96_01G243200 [Sorghum bicolor]|uniref:Uncharacterized protein n=2 Tax=Sorghum bicolor TaxID=4558 RepID=A0A1B6QKG4_SORBI|nr:hypothetical protein BDA96_01G243200 [Sorghum bicolor]KXG38406.1 hypothetical protein SORBI_3001G228800 [Sorghum bicolor]